VVVTTSSSKQHMQEYLAVPDLPPLTDEDIRSIDLAGAKGPPSQKLDHWKVCRNIAISIAWILIFVIIWI